ncbi:MAG: NAD(P)-binding domain-containing protein [Candidatus Cloacimonetes bacterium]|nr:NAD(P)-binding domain-containing protein [Candidatus Cloacimonadota bacterium]
MSKRVLLATEKAFAAPAVKGIEEIFSKAGYVLTKLENYKEKSDLLKAVETAEAVIIRSDIVDKEVMDVAKDMKIVVRAGAGYDNIDIAIAKEKNIVAMNTPGQNSNAVAELVIGMMIYLARGKFNGKSGTELRGKKLGIHAYGNVGRFVAMIAKGFGMEVYAYDPFVAKEKMEADGLKVFTEMKELYKNCEYISLHLPKTKDTVKSINYDVLSQMPEGATLINTARAEVVCEESIVKIMEERKDFRYATDITPSNDKEMQIYGDRYFATPKKMGAQTEEANINAGIAAANQIVNFFEKADISFKVN